MKKKEKILLTSEGERALKEKLQKLKDEYDEVSRGKMEAAEQGGNLWHDNPAFEEVEQKQLMLAHMIAETEETLRNSMVITTSRHNDGDVRVEIGSVLEIRLEDSTPRTISIGGSGESNPAKGMVSYLSPLGEALLDARENEEREYTAGGKTRKVTILKITKKVL